MQKKVEKEGKRNKEQMRQKSNCKLKIYTKQY